MTILRAGAYERVSTEEQSKFGFSISDQEEAITEYCEKNSIKIVDHYKDEGISGAKPPLKRPALQRLIDDVEAGNIDIILFTRLDRWFRSVKEYFKVQEILDRHGVQWKAIRENYDTTTANGQMAITIFLAVAQNERDKGAERVRAVLKTKRKNKEACFGGPHKPMGYMKQKDENGVMRLVKDPKQEQMTQEFWNILVKQNNLAAAIRHMNDVYGVTKSEKTWRRIAHSPFYCGMWDGIEEFCEPYVSMEDWLMIQETADRRRQDTRAKNIYLFSGMMRCPECGHVLCGTYKNNVRKGYEWLRNYLPNLVNGLGDWNTNFAHDESKSQRDEYEAYDAYFYGGNRSYQVVQAYNRAWLLHLHRNPHHWQHWVLINDDPEEGEVLLDMPMEYIIEMICDWWSFSWKTGDLFEIFNWYEEHKDHIKLSVRTRNIVENIMNKGEA